MLETGPAWASIDAGAALGAQPSTVDSWWFVGLLHGSGTDFTVKAQVLSVNDACRTTVSIVDRGNGDRVQGNAGQDLSDVHISEQEFAVTTSLVSASGTTEAMGLRAVLPEGSFDVTLNRTTPVLYGAGTGHFPFFTTDTYQYALPGMSATGSLTLAGRHHAVQGSVWLDRQWFPTVGEMHPFSGMGLSLETGEYLTVWSDTGSGEPWLTELRPDGSHQVTAVELSRSEDRWDLRIPALDGALTVDFEEQDSNPGIFTGFCRAVGTLHGAPTRGFGFIDIAG